MSWMRNSWPLKWFKDISNEYVFSCSGVKEDFVQDYNSDYDHKPSLIELLATFIMEVTNDEKYTKKMVKILAKDYKLEHLLRKKPLTPEQSLDLMDKMVKHNAKERGR